MKTIRFYLDLLEERLWFKPALHAFGAAALVLVAIMSDRIGAISFLPEVETSTLDKLLTIISTSMLGIATFAVASMVAAFASASTSATPRAFKLVIADNVSQQALSAFVGAYIFSIIGLVAVESDLFAKNGSFVLFSGILLTLAWVILTFVRWVDNIARLGRMGDTITKVTKATTDAVAEWAPSAALPTRPARFDRDGVPIAADHFGHLQHIKMDDLAEWAERSDAEVHINAQPGTFVGPGDCIAEVRFDADAPDRDVTNVRKAFVVGLDRSFNCDPCFGLITLSEIGSRALSPGVNDPGTAIDVIKRMMIIFREWNTIQASCDAPHWNRLSIDPLPSDSVFDDAFHGIERDGANNVEVGIWLQRCYADIAEHGNRTFAEQARKRARNALKRATECNLHGADLQRLERAAAFSAEPVAAPSPTPGDG